MAGSREVRPALLAGSREGIAARGSRLPKRCFFRAVLKVCLLATDFNRWGRLFHIVPPEYRRLALKRLFLGRGNDNI